MDINRQQKAPIYEALEEFKKRRVVPFDVPGHKRGRGNPELVQLLGQKCVELDVNSMKLESSRSALISAGGIKDALTMSKRKRFAIHFASRLSVFLPFMALTYLGCVRTTCICVSRMLKTGIQYLPVDSMQTSWQLYERS